ncbi:type 4a pilus biogenesis protein PilO [Kingella negevensis]|uniref:type 4a pilus biogenesis protein PilO n=1 Tax=Kingella negevensis TaxID=1522312 RepID=UPI002543B01F|nr:type 4a pilus biogenesis protein PilO [Kingella negevensis]WII92285.1 type 4a pilus biogenesis protein PilO [Kingella negevensis]
MNLNEIDFKKLHLQNKPIQFLMALILAVVIVVLGYFGLFQAQWEEYQSTIAKEAELKSDYEKKSAQAANLDNLKKELVDIEASIEVLIKQLPTSEEIPTLIQELHQAAAKNGLTMNSVTPEAKVIEKPIERLPFAISVTGNYSNVAQFVRDVGSMSRIVTLSNINITKSEQNGEGSKLTFTATANTYKAMNLTDTASSASAASKPANNADE